MSIIGKVKYAPFLYLYIQNIIVFIIYNLNVIYWKQYTVITF